MLGGALTNRKMIELSYTKRNEYLHLRRQYLPGMVKLVVIAESPPASGRYFYDPTVAPSEQLFAAPMKQLRLSPNTKEEGLREFQRRGWVLVDATYEPVNKLADSCRDKVIARDYTLLRDDLRALIAGDDPVAPLILIKANVCGILEPKLVPDGFKVLNRGCRIPFPGSGQQKKFYQKLGAILEAAGLLSNLRVE
jgi:hypothetical protein